MYDEWIQLARQNSQVWHGFLQIRLNLCQTWKFNTKPTFTTGSCVFLSSLSNEKVSLDTCWPIRARVAVGWSWAARERDWDSLETKSGHEFHSSCVPNLEKCMRGIPRGTETKLTVSSGELSSGQVKSPAGSARVVKVRGSFYSMR